MKIGRNDLCPCGSGKKYKKCCITETSNSHETLDFAWHELRKTEGKLIEQHLLPYVGNKLPKELLEQAMHDFFPETLPENMDNELLYENFFSLGLCLIGFYMTQMN